MSLVDDRANFSCFLKACRFFALAWLTGFPLIARAVSYDISTLLATKAGKASYGEINAYAKAVAAIREGDELIFRDAAGQKIFPVKKVLGHGNTTLIVDIGEGKAMRIPYRVGAERYLEAFAQENALLKSGGVDVIRTYPELSSKQFEYLVVENEPVRFTLAQLLAKEQDEIGYIASSNREPWKLHVPDREALLEKLAPFVESTAGFRDIADFTPSQIAWNGDRWLLLDMGNVAFANLDSIKSGKILSSKPAIFPTDPQAAHFLLKGYNGGIFKTDRIPAAVRARLVLAAQRGREARRLRPTALQRCSRFFGDLGVRIKASLRKENDSLF